MRRGEPVRVRGGTRRGLRPCSTPPPRGAASLGCRPRPHPPRLCRRARSTAGSSESPGLAACLGGYRSRIGFGAPRGLCVGRWVPRFPGGPARAAPPHATFPPADSSLCRRTVPVPSPARAGSAAECADWRVTSRQEKPVSMGLPFDGLRSPGFLPCAGLSRLIYHVERCKVRP